jgi:endonuclease/exonuclease/phosphatase family metal-dependent hydrolase
MRLLSRRVLSVFILLLTASSLIAQDGPVRVRVAAANISTGNKQSYDPGEGIRIFQAAKPDIVAIQEFNYGNKSPEAMREFVDKAFGPGYGYYREQGRFQIPNGIISRYPIEQSGHWDDPEQKVPNRGFAWAQVRLPNGEHMWVVSVHLLTKSPGARNAEAEELVKLIKANVPKGAYLVIAGDFNTKSDRESVINTLSDVAGENHDAREDRFGPELPYDGDEENDGSKRYNHNATNANHKFHYDWVLASTSLARFQVPSELPADPGEEKRQRVNYFPEGLIFDTSRMKHVPEPAQREDSASNGMQHHMVIKDYVIPAARVHGGAAIPRCGDSRCTTH